MNKRVLGFLALLPGLLRVLSGQVDLDYGENRSVTWAEAISMYEWLDDRYEEARLVEAGPTDAGKPLHLFIISGSGRFTPAEAREAGLPVLFINNGIHPGEPCGIDASLKLADGLLSGTDPYAGHLDSVVVVIVPVFNIGGALNRSPYHRANQNGPAEQGFRGNARNLDLNRDFIKLDAENTRTMVSQLRAWDPHIFVDTHTSNGADYPYVITLINSHEQRHEPVQSDYLEQHLKPFLFSSMKQTPYEMIPYVWSYRGTPETGIVGFMDYPRYASGYASLFNTLSFTVETHMFKPFSDRVLSTWHLLREMLRFTALNSRDLITVKQKAGEQKLERSGFTLEWELDTTRWEPLSFRGYRAGWKPSVVTGHDRLYYDRSQPWEKEIPYYRYFRPVATATAPEYYIVPSAWHEVVDRLKLNGVEMSQFPRDTVLTAEVSYIEDFETSRRPYNGHYRHSGVKVNSKMEEVRILAGTYLVPTRQAAREYLVQTLEPGGRDSFFSWNFFDEILFRNEYFSPYIFEETAGRLLETDPDLRKSFREKQRTDSGFSENPYQQLRYIYENSPWSEPTYRRYPVSRIP